MGITPPYEKAAEEAAKAVQKVAGIADKTIDTANSVGGFLRKVLGSGFEELGGAFSDWAQVYRYEQAVKLADRVKRIHQERGIEGKTVSIATRLAIPLLQQSTLEDDDTLLNMWAGLIANATDPNSKVEARRSFCGLLSSLEPLDALVLAEIHRWKLHYPGRTGISGDISLLVQDREPWPNQRKIAIAVIAPEIALALSLENLERLGLIYDYMPNVGVEDQEQAHGASVPVTHELAMLDLTHTGVALLEACQHE